MSGSELETALDLRPWLIVLGTAPDTSLASWSVASSTQPSVALFSTRDKAVNYALANCEAPYQLVQFEQTSLIRVLAECYRQGTRYAALDPTEASARQLFILRDVLSAARHMLQHTKIDP